MKLLAKITKFFTLKVLILLLILGLGYTAMRSYTFQNHVVQLVIKELAADMQTEITIESIDVGWWKTITLNHALIKDQEGDTLIYAKKLKAKYSSFDNVKHVFAFKYVELDGGKVHFEKLKDAKNSNYKFFIDYFKPKKKRDPNDPKVIWTITSKKLNIINTQFRFHDYNYEQPADRRFNEYFVEFNDIAGSVDTLAIVDDSLSFHINKMYAKERSGLVIMGLKADARIHSRALEFYDMLLTTPHSTLKNEVVLNYKNYDELEDFIDKVDIQARLQNSKVGLKDIAYFYEGFWGRDRTFKLSGNSSGPIKRLDVKDIDLVYGKDTKLKGNIDFSDLPDIQNTLIDANIKLLETSMEEFTDLLELRGVNSNLFGIGKIQFKGMFIGFTHDFVSRGNWQTDLGNAVTDLKFNYANQHLNEANYKGKMSTSGFDLAPILAGSGLGKFAGDITIDGKGLNLENLDMTTQSKIQSIAFNGKNISNAEVDGRIAKGLFDGTIAVKDPQLAVNFDGTVDFVKKVPFIDFVADIQRANLSYFGLDTGISVLKAHVTAGLQGDNIDNIVGNLSIDFLKLEKGNKVYAFENTNITSERVNNYRTLNLTSDMADAQLKGYFQLEKLPMAFNNFLWNLMPAYFKFNKLSSPENFTFDVNIKQPDLLLSYMPEYLRFKRTELKGAYNSEENTLQATIRSEEIGINNLKLIGLNAKIDKPLNTALTFLYDAPKTKYGNATVTDSLKIRATAENNVLNIAINAKSDSLNYLAKLDGDFLFDKDLIDVKINDGSLKVDERNWQISESGLIKWQENKILLSAIEIKNQEQLLQLNGTVSKDINDLLLIDFYNFQPGSLLGDLGLLGKDTLDGVASGWVKLYNLYNLPLFESDFTYNNVAWNGDELGNIAVKAININKEIINLNGTKVTAGPFSGLEVKGIIDLNKNHQNYDLKLNLPKSDISILGKFMKDIASDLKGQLKGTNISLTGKFDQPKLNGELVLTDASFTIDYLKTSYQIKESFIVLNPNSIDVKPTNIIDINNNPGTLRGNVKHKNFSNWYFNIFINDINKMQVLNTTQEDNALFYGQGYASGKASFTGPLEGIDIYMNLKTERGTKVTLPLEDGESQSALPYVHFKNKHEEEERKVVKAFSNINAIVVELEATEDAEAEMVFDSKAGDIMKGSGKGNLKFELNKAADFYMYGTYEIERGSYLFTAFNFVNKPFVIEKGGTIAWDGDPFNAKLNITAVYRQKASLDALVDPSRYSTTEEYERVKDGLKTPIDVYSKIILTGVLIEPKIDFDITFPNLQSQGAAAVEVSQFKSRFQNDPQELNKQFLSLLVFNRFLPTNFSQFGTVVSAAPGQSAGELLSSQLNNWISALGIDSSLMINFDRGKDAQNQANWVVSVEKKFFNDRLNFKYSQAVQNTVSNATNVSLEYNISRDGHIKIRTNYAPLYSGNIYTGNNQQGLGGSRRGTVGIFFRKEFETIFKKKKDK